MPTFEHPPADRKPWDHLERSRLELLLRCLAFEAPMPSPTCRDWDRIIAAGLTTGLLPDVAERLQQERPDALPVEHEGSERARHLDTLVASYRYRRRCQCQMLLEAVRAWNRAGLEPLLTIGAREVWLGKSSGHGVNDLGVLVKPRDYEVAGTALQELGYSRPSSLVPNWYRRESGWSHPRNSYVMLRALGCNRHIERLLPAKLMLGESETSTIDGAKVRLLPEWLDVVHSMLHHQFDGAGSRLDSVTPQALYQFAVTQRGLTGDDVVRLQEFLAQNPSVAAIHQSWLKAAEGCFGRLSAHAAQDDARWQKPGKSEAAIGGKVLLVDDRSGWRIALTDRAGRSMASGLSRRALAAMKILFAAGRANSGQTQSPNSATMRVRDKSSGGDKAP